MSETEAKPERVRTWSIKRRLTVLYVVSVFAMLLISTIFLYWVLVNRLQIEDGQFLAAKIGLLREILSQEPNNAEVLEEEVKWETAPFRLAKYYARILDSRDSVLIETEKMSSIAPIGIFPQPAGVSHVPLHPTKWKSGDGHNLLLMSALAVAGGKSHRTRILQLALDISHEDELISDYKRELLLVLVAGILISAGVGIFIAGKGLRPIERITKTVQRISAHQLHQRLLQHSATTSDSRLKSNWPVELNDLAAAFDEMLDRLEASFNRLSQFSADLAHELRTPINNLIGETEVALSRDRSPADYREVLESSLEEFSRLSHVIESLLFLARAESPEAHVDKKDLALRSEIQNIIEFYEAIAEEKGVMLSYRISPETAGDLTVNADPTLLRQAISNLVSNAVHYTRRGGNVEIDAKLGADREVEISVSDNGIGIAEEHLPRIFDRFYRADSSRSENKTGSGLGLSIVRSIMRLHHGTAEVASEPGKGTKVTLKFPGDGQSAG